MTPSKQRISVVSAQTAYQLDQKLFEIYSLDQLVELAGLSCAQSIFRFADLESSIKSFLVIVGPGNNGADGLVLARYLKSYNCPVTLVEPKPKSTPLHDRLVSQLDAFKVDRFSSLEDIDINAFDFVVDAIFGFSFDATHGIRAPFDSIIKQLGSLTNVISIDVPSGWEVNTGPGTYGCITPVLLVSLTLPKPFVFQLKNECHHYIGGRFVPPALAEEFGLQLPTFKGAEFISIVEPIDIFCKGV
ncbi:hypothetical protein GEMRC1_002095 [Eukaryota sp. GEM-RC1]